MQRLPSRLSARADSGGRHRLRGLAADCLPDSAEMSKAVRAVRAAKGLVPTLLAIARGSRGWSMQALRCQRWPGARRVSAAEAIHLSCLDFLAGPVRAR